MVRKYTNQDTVAVVEVWRLASDRAHSFLNASFVARAEQDLQEIYLPKTETWVYEEYGAVVGFISMLNNEVGGLFVLPRFQGKGVGSALVDFVACKFSELEVEVFERNFIGRAFYKKYGFTPIKSYAHEESGEVVIRLKFVISARQIKI